MPSSSYTCTVQERVVKGKNNTELTIYTLYTNYKEPLQNARIHNAETIVGHNYIVLDYTVINVVCCEGSVEILYKSKYKKGWCTADTNSKV